MNMIDLIRGLPVILQPNALIGNTKKWDIYGHTQRQNTGLSCRRYLRYFGADTFLNLTGNGGMQYGTMGT